MTCANISYLESPKSLGIISIGKFDCFMKTNKVLPIYYYRPPARSKSDHNDDFDIYNLSRVLTLVQVCALSSKLYIRPQWFRLLLILCYSSGRVLCSGILAFLDLTYIPIGCEPSKKCLPCSTFTQRKCPTSTLKIADIFTNRIHFYGYARKSISS